tara:strand:- start:253 stop:1566 length:1314 start_codon:yes stop_codon:yes gene_type:complete
MARRARARKERSGKEGLIDLSTDALEIIVSHTDSLTLAGLAFTSKQLLALAKAAAKSRGPSFDRWTLAAGCSGAVHNCVDPVVTQQQDLHGTASAVITLCSESGRLRRTKVHAIRQELFKTLERSGHSEQIEGSWGIAYQRVVPGWRPIFGVKYLIPCTLGGSEGELVRAVLVLGVTRMDVSSMPEPVELKLLLAADAFLRLQPSQWGPRGSWEEAAAISRIGSDLDTDADSLSLVAQPVFIDGTNVIIWAQLALGLHKPNRPLSRPEVGNNRLLPELNAFHLLSMADPGAGMPTPSDLFECTKRCWRVSNAADARRNADDAAFWPAGPVFDLIFDATKQRRKEWDAVARPERTAPLFVTVRPRPVRWLNKVKLRRLRANANWGSGDAPGLEALWAQLNAVAEEDTAQAQRLLLKIVMLKVRHPEEADVPDVDHLLW